MVGFIVFLLAGAILYASFPVFVVFATIIGALWLVNNYFKGRQETADFRRDNRAALAARADQQHQQIMQGDLYGGTYGRYPPAC